MKIIRLYLLVVIIFSLLVSCKDDEINEDILKEPFDKEITVITIHDSIVWVGTMKNGLYKLEGDSWINYTKANGLLSDEITAILIDNSKTLWVGTALGMSKYENAKWIHFTTTEGLFNNYIRCLECDLDNSIWIGTNKNRITKYDGTKFTTYHVNPLASGDIGHIHTISCDLFGDIWVGSCISGLSRFDGENWFDNINDLKVFVESSTLTEDGDLWIGHFMGAYKFSGGEWTKYSEMDGLANHTILSIDADYQNNIWFGTKNGFSKFNGTTWINYTIDNDPLWEFVSSIACDHKGDIWIGNSNGLKIFTPN
jgi:ligand-binding sensor domain-containing protein